jgi:hypothetical protein
MRSGLFGPPAAKKLTRSVPVYHADISPSSIFDESEWQFSDPERRELGDSTQYARKK